MKGKLTQTQLKEFLDEKASQYNSPEFLTSDPIQIPHRFAAKEDIEISAFLIATIAWGNRISIIKSGNRLIELLGNNPYDFILNHSEKELATLENFVHRTFNGTDLKFFIQSLKNIYTNQKGLEDVFRRNSTENTLQTAIHEFKKVFFSIPHPERTLKHISDPLKNSAAKRLNMFLRWMVRQDNAGVDFGIWKSLTPALLSCPLDVHSGNVARKLGLLSRKQNDAKALLELDTSLRKLDPIDPAKYDFALFGLGVFEGFK